MRIALEIARAGLDGLRLHRLRAAITVACVAVVLTPYLVGLGISHAVRRQAEESIRLGADLYVNGTQFGRTATVPLRLRESIQALDGVIRVEPRIVGQLRLGRENFPVVVVGTSPESWPPSVQCVEGRLPLFGNTQELVVGTELAARMGWKVGDRVPPFYRNRQGERVSTVVGLFRSDISLWQSNMMLVPLETAATIFDQSDRATDLAVYCRPGYAQTLASAILASQEEWLAPAAGVRLNVTTREEVAATLPRGLLHREGIFNLHFVLAFAVGIPLVLATSGIGLPERRREVGLLKALGWQTDEILLRCLAENVGLCLLAAATAILTAFAWLRLANGVGVAALFLPGVGWRPSFRIPFQLTPLPVLLTLLISLAIVLVGTIWSTWRTAITAPIEAMQ